MGNAASDFQKRMSRINRKHARMENGYVAVVGRDGLIVTKAKRGSAGRSFRMLAGLVLGFFAFKVLLITQLGTLGYEARVEQLRTGTVIEQGGAFLLQVDPLSAAIAQKIQQFTL